MNYGNCGTHVGRLNQHQEKNLAADYDPSV